LIFDEEQKAALKAAMEAKKEVSDSLPEFPMGPPLSAQTRTRSRSVIQEAPGERFVDDRTPIKTNRPRTRTFNSGYLDLHDPRLPQLPKRSPKQNSASSSPGTRSRSGSLFKTILQKGSFTPKDKEDGNQDKAEKKRGRTFSFVLSSKDGKKNFSTEEPAIAVASWMFKTNLLRFNPHNQISSV
jgi:hypothetical protein